MLVGPELILTRESYLQIEELYDQIQKHLDKSTQGFLRGLLCLGDGDSYHTYENSTIFFIFYLFVINFKSIQRSCLLIQ